MQRPICESPTRADGYKQKLWKSASWERENHDAVQRYSLSTHLYMYGFGLVGVQSCILVQDTIELFIRSPLSKLSSIVFIITHNCSSLRSDLRLCISLLWSSSSFISCADLQSSGAQHRACSENLNHGSHFSLSLFSQESPAMRAMRALKPL